MDIKNLYPAVSFPVSRHTPMISPIIKWDHSENYVVPLFDTFNNYERRNISVNLSDKAFEFVQGHIIDGELRLVLLVENILILDFVLSDHRKSLVPGNWLDQCRLGDIQHDAWNSTNADEGCLRGR